MFRTSIFFICHCSLANPVSWDSLSRGLFFKMNRGESVRAVQHRTTLKYQATIIKPLQYTSQKTVHRNLDKIAMHKPAAAPPPPTQPTGGKVNNTVCMFNLNKC